jgi:ferredoxin
VGLTARINPIACDAHGLCVELLPELFRLDEWGYPIIDVPTVPPDLERLAERAARACPTLAIVIERAPAPR